MKSLVPAFFLLAVPLANAAPLVHQVEKSKRVHNFNAALSTQEYQLPNGLSVFLSENPKSPNVVVAHWVKAGSLHEAPGSTGVAHLFEHMMFRPLAPKEASFFEIASQLGAEANANTRFESTFYVTTVAPEKLNELLKREADRFQTLRVTKELLDVERKAVWSEYSTKFDADPIADLWVQIYREGFKGHPFEWMIIGFRDDLEKITADDCNAFFQKFYRPNNTGLFITGNFKSKEVLKEILALYSDWKPGQQSQLPSQFDQKTKEIIAEGKLPSEARHVLFGFRTPYFDRGNAKIQALANYILFDGENGLLKRRLVDEKRLAATVEEFNFTYDNGMQKASIVGLADSDINQIRSEAAHVRSDFESMSAKEFDSYKRNFYIRTSERAQRNAELSKLLALSWGKYGDLDLAAAFTGKPLDVSKEQVQKFLSQYYVPDNFVFMTHKGQGK